MARKTDHGEEVIKPNVFMRIGLFIKQIIDELRKVVTPTRKQLFYWSLAVFIFVALLMGVRHRNGLRTRQALIPHLRLSRYPANRLQYR